MAKKIRNKILSIVLAMTLLVSLCAQNVAAAAPEPLFQAEEVNPIPYAAPQATPTDLYDEAEVDLQAALELQAAIDAATDGTEASPTDIVVSGTVALSEKLVLNNDGISRHIRLTGGGRLTRAPGFIDSMIHVAGFYENFQGQDASLTLEDITLDGAKGHEDDCVKSPIISIYAYGTLYIHEGAVLENNEVYSESIPFSRPASAIESYKYKSFSVYMYGGIIRNNKLIQPKYDRGVSAGVYFHNQGGMYMSGGQIINNSTYIEGKDTGTYDVYGMLRVSGSPVIGTEDRMGCRGYIEIVDDLTAQASIHLGIYYGSSSYSAVATKPSGNITELDVAAFHSWMDGYRVVASSKDPNGLYLDKIIGTDLQALIDAAPAASSGAPHEISVEETIFLHEPLVIAHSTSGEVRNIRLTGMNLRRTINSLDNMIVVPQDSRLELEDITLDGYANPSKTQATVVNEGVLDIRAGTQLINSCRKRFENLMGGALVNSGIVNMSGGRIANNCIEVTNEYWYGMGAGVYNEGEFNMSGGIIENNHPPRIDEESTNKVTATYRGGGIYNAGRLIVSGDALISGNEATQGGGVYNAGTFIYDGDALSGNMATDGGGLCNAGQATITGNITDNEASARGGGVYASEAFTLSGGSVAGNTTAGQGGEVFLADTAVLTLAHGACIGQDGTMTGLYQDNPWDNDVVISQALGGNALVVMETPVTYEDTVLARGAASYAVSAADALCFKIPQPYVPLVDPAANVLVATTQVNVPRTLTFTQPALIVEVGQSAQLEAVASHPEITTVNYTVRQAKPEGIITVDADGRITTTGTGMAYVRAYCAENPAIYDESRIDITAASQPGDAISPYHLTDTIVTVYTKQEAPVTLDLWQEAVKPGFKLGGMTGRSIEFYPAGRSSGHRNMAAAATQAFTLSVSGERGITLKLKDPVDEKNLKNKYKVKLRVVGEENPLPETLTIKINKKAPSLKAQPVSINYFYADLRALVRVNGGKVTALELNEDRSPTNDKLLDIAKGGWLKYQDGTITLVKEVKKRGTLHLLATVEGWTAPVPVSVSVKSVYSPPDVKLSPSAMHFFGEKKKCHRDSAASVYLRPRSKKETLNSLRITDVILIPNEELTKAEAKKYKSQYEFISGEYMRYNANTGEIHIGHNGRHSLSMDGHPGPLLLGVKVHGSNKLIRLPLKTSLKTNLGRIVFSKKSISFNPQLGEDDSVTVTYKLSAMPTATLELSHPDNIYLKERGRYYELPAELLPVTTRQNAGNSLTFTPRACIIPGATYVLAFLYNPSVGDGWPVTTLLTIKIPASSTPQAYSILKSKGSVDLSKGGAATITTKFSGYNGSYATQNPFTIKDPSGESVTTKFDIARTGDNTWSVRSKTDYPLITGTYKLSANGETASGHPIASVKDINLNVVATKPKLSKSVSSLTLYPGDPTAEKIFRLTLPAGFKAIDKVEVTNPNKHIYDIDYLGDNYCVVKIRNDQHPNAKDAARATVEFKVTLKGNADAIIKSSIRINIT